MKRFILAVLVAMTATSCATLKPTQRLVLSAFSDYRPYQEEGFLISPNAYTYNFESVGEIDIIVEPARIKKLVESQYSSYEALDYETIPYDELVAIAVKEAKEKGADALVNFSIKREASLELNRTSGRYMTKYTYYIKGFCIKRK
jgi:Holliday junction resolvase-like predicted endonuclease